MMQAVSPYSGGSRSKAEILARYRPIAPKPEAPTSPSADNNALPENIRKSAFLRNVWPHLQARPTRTRKRGRSAFALPPLKRARSCFQGFAPAAAPPPPPYHQVLNSSAAANTWANYPTGFPQIPMIHHPNLPPLMDSPAAAETSGGGRVLRGIDLNREAAESPEEFDFMPQLQPVITPHPVRLIGSTVFVGCILHSDPPAPPYTTSLKTAADVESEAEAVSLPILVSDVNNKVRLANSAYKELVGQPECRWLDLLPPFHSPCKTISGEVAIQFSNSVNLPVSSNRFTCWVRMEWSNNDGKKTTVRAFCDAVKLACHSKDYLFQWRFHTSDNNSSKSACFQHP
ncbi:PREDICTED: uncharacterized protein LOC109152755 [Ipomoea nil]|uniref:uncharacterized protein LOC109152755 n=1 Tax=Ipomoea nil TaxID=35883 RepID=UPI00090123C0|nr:PREDICTED: uncharacterized protein LOC109152755 [Ipomoea nil]